MITEAAFRHAAERGSGAVPLAPDVGADSFPARLFKKDSPVAVLLPVSSGVH